MRILVGTDFSVQAVRAADAAAALANTLGDSLLLAHVYDRSGFEELSPRVLAEIAGAAERNLKKEAERIRNTGVTVHTELMTGAAYDCLIEKARPDFVRLAVVSSHSRSTVGRWLLGSVSERVAEGAAVPTLVVRNSRPIEEWAAGDRPLRVVIACDLTPACDSALAFARFLTEHGPCELTAVHVDSPLEERARLGIASPVSMTENDPEVQRVIERDLRRRVVEVIGDTPCSVVVEPNLGRPDAAAIHVANARQADLVITGTHQRRGAARLAHVSFSRGLLHDCPLNVLCVPTGAGSGTVHPVSRVLAVTDLSRFGNEAVARAFGLSRAGGVVHLLHVLPPNEWPNPLIGGQMRKARPTKKEWAKMKRHVEAKLAELIPSGAAALGIESEIELVEERDVAKAIAQAAERLDADAICLATHGHTGLAGSLMGSVAQALMKATHRPLHLIRSDTSLAR